MLTAAVLVQLVVCLPHTHDHEVGRSIPALDCELLLFTGRLLLQVGTAWELGGLSLADVRHTTMKPYMATTSSFDSSPTLGSLLHILIVHTYFQLSFLRACAHSAYVILTASLLPGLLGGPRNGFQSFSSHTPHRSCRAHKLYKFSCTIHLQDCQKLLKSR